VLTALWVRSLILTMFVSAHPWPMARTVAERQRALRSYTEEAIRAGMPEGLWERLVEC
jgi:hypothetical protein